MTESSSARHRNPEKEFRRWSEGVEEAESRLHGCEAPIHLMDREADSYELFHFMVQGDRRFVIRLTHDRVLSGGSRLFNQLEQLPGIAERDVLLGNRKRHSAPSHRKIHPPRKTRRAKLAFAAASVELPRPQHIQDAEKTLQLNVVRVFEVDTPPGADPIEWRLITTEPVSTLEQVLFVVDCYRKRWVIEEFFKALKTGCSVEKRQLEGLDSLLNMMAMFAPIAWTMLRMRILAREASNTPAEAVLSQTQIAILKSSPRTKRLVGQIPTVRDAFLSIAAMGGHLSRNGEPGWITLYRGYEKLLNLEDGWNLRDLCETYVQS